ncbi:MAG: hypothetical protein IH604_16040 [Burkholderiales bacterium]|nr:hypothetical protein [Burkholderiales bacterium]
MTKYGFGKTVNMAFDDAIAVSGWVLAFAMAAFTLAAPAASAGGLPHDAVVDSVEARFSHVLQDLKDAKLPIALEEIERLVERYPSWRLAYEAPVGKVPLALPESFSRQRASLGQRKR